MKTVNTIDQTLRNDAHPTKTTLCEEAKRRLLAVASTSVALFMSPYGFYFPIIFYDARNTNSGVANLTNFRVPTLIHITIYRHPKTAHGGSNGGIALS